MTVAFDEHTQGNAASFTHTPVGTPRGVLVLILTRAQTTDLVTGVTYGGAAMSEIGDSPLFDVDTTEACVLHGFFLGSGISTGAQTVAITATGGPLLRSDVYTVTAAADTVVQDTGAIAEEGVTGARTGTLLLGGKDCFVAEIVWSAGDTAADVSPLTNWTAQRATDEGTQSSFGHSYDIIGSADVTFGATHNVTNGITILAAAITEAGVGKGLTQGILLNRRSLA